MFPRLSNLLTNTVPFGEKLPTTNRNMNFTVTVRDNHSTNGGVNQDNVLISVVNTLGPFAVTAPNTSGLSFNANATTNVTWNGSNTAGGAIGATNVNILLSTDGGLTYPVVLAANVANDGSETITIPNIATTQARIKVKPTNNVFFDISNFNFTINAVLVQPPSEPDLTTPSDSGISTTDNLTNDNTPTFSGTAAAGATITLYDGANVIGNGTADGNGDWSITSSLLSDGPHSVTAIATVGGNNSTASNPLVVTIDTAAPEMVADQFQFETTHLEQLRFSESVEQTISTNLLTIENLTTSGIVPTPFLLGSYNSGNNRYSVTFPGVSGGILPDGNYRATVATTVADDAGNTLSGPNTAEFYVFAGDANRDRSVNINDFSILAARFNLPGTFSQGDFNYDGGTNISDFSILAAKFNSSLPAPASLPRAASSLASAPVRTFGNGLIEDKDVLDILN